jgi:hypothetical protein
MPGWFETVPETFFGSILDPESRQGAPFPPAGRFCDDSNIFLTFVWFSNNHRPWPADRVERWPIERLMPYANNLSSVKRRCE